MMGYSNFPPFPYFMQILRHFPNSAMLYIKLWSEKNDHHAIKVKKSDISKVFLLTPTNFRNRLFNIMEEGLASVRQTPDFYHIELVGFDDETFNEEEEDYEFQ